VPVSEETYRQLAVEDPEGKWELYCGALRRKPGMTLEHNRAADELAYVLRSQLDPKQFNVRVDKGAVRISAQNYFIPDVYVIPVELQHPLRGTRALEWYDAPLPLVIEVWSPSTGSSDLDTRLGEYQRRGDLEIWRVHPYEPSLTAWARQPDGTYSVRVYTEGLVQPVALPGVTVDLDTLFG